MESNFRNSCPLKLKCLPSTPCECGKPNNPKKVEVEPSCPWWIASEQYNYCFWRYIFNKSDEAGDLGEPSLQELAKLYGCSATKVHFMITEALQELAKVINKDKLESKIDLEDFFTEFLEITEETTTDISNL